MKKHEAEAIAQAQADDAATICSNDKVFSWDDRAIARASAFCGAMGALASAGLIDSE